MVHHRVVKMDNNCDSVKTPSTFHSKKKINRLSILGLPDSLDPEMCEMLEVFSNRRKRRQTAQTSAETTKLVSTYCGNWLEVVAQTKYKIMSSSTFQIPSILNNTPSLFSGASKVWDVHSETKDNVLKHVKTVYKRIQTSKRKNNHQTYLNATRGSDKNNSTGVLNGVGGGLPLLLNVASNLDEYRPSGESRKLGEEGIIPKVSGNRDGDDDGVDYSNDDDDDDDDGGGVEEENFLDSTNQILGLESGKLDTTTLTGDERLDMFRELLDMFNWEREDNQIEFHEIMIQTVLPKIFTKEWDTDYERIMRMFKMEKHKAETFIICPRRYGKTVSVAMFCAAYLYMIPNASIAIFSTSKRTSGKMMTAVYGFMRELPFFDQVYFETKNSECIKIVMYGNERSVWSYPGTVAVCVFFSSTFFFLSSLFFPE